MYISTHTTNDALICCKLNKTTYSDFRGRWFRYLLITSTDLVLHLSYSIIIIMCIKRTFNVKNKKLNNNY